MKTISRFAFCVLCILPLIARASSETDRAAELTVRSSYNFRVLLQGHIGVEVHDGIASLTGVVTDADLRLIAGDTARSLSAISSVDNQIGIDEKRAGLSDASIAVKVRTILHTQACVSLDTVHMTVNGSIVLLQGSIATNAQRLQLGRTITMIDWVRDVRNELGVRAFADEGAFPVEAIDDGSITAFVQFVLNCNRATVGVKPRITTLDGVVLLDGGSGTSTEKAYAAQLASSIRGVRSVVNQIQVF